MCLLRLCLHVLSQADLGLEDWGSMESVCTMSHMQLSRNLSRGPAVILLTPKSPGLDPCFGPAFAVIWFLVLSLGPDFHSSAAVDKNFFFVSLTALPAHLDLVLSHVPNMNNFIFWVSDVLTRICQFGICFLETLAPYLPPLSFFFVYPLIFIRFKGFPVQHHTANIWEFLTPCFIQGKCKPIVC